VVQVDTDRPSVGFGSDLHLVDLDEMHRLVEVEAIQAGRDTESVADRPDVSAMAGDLRMDDAALGGAGAVIGMLAGAGIPGLEASMVQALAAPDGVAADTLRRFGVVVGDNPGQPQTLVAIIEALQRAGATSQDILSFLLWLIDNPVKVALDLSIVQTETLKMGVTTLFQ
jgi:hypothetical protein